MLAELKTTVIQFIDHPAGCVATTTGAYLTNLLAASTGGTPEWVTSASSFLTCFILANVAWYWIWKNIGRGLSAYARWRRKGLMAEEQDPDIIPGADDVPEMKG